MQAQVRRRPRLDDYVMYNAPPPRMQSVPGVNPELPPPSTSQFGQPGGPNIMDGMREAIARADEARRVQQEIEELKRRTNRIKAQSAFFKAQQQAMEWRDQGVSAQDRTAAQGRQIREGEIERLKQQAVSPTAQQALSWRTTSPEYQDFITWGGEAPDLEKLRLQAAEEQVAENTGYLPEVAPGVVELGPSLSKKPLSTREYAYGRALEMRRNLKADLAARRMQEAEAAWQRAHWRPPGRGEVEMMKAEMYAPQFDYRKTPEGYREYLATSAGRAPQFDYRKTEAGFREHLEALRNRDRGSQFDYRKTEEGYREYLDALGNRDRGRLRPVRGEERYWTFDPRTGKYVPSPVKTPAPGQMFSVPIEDRSDLPGGPLSETEDTFTEGGFGGLADAFNFGEPATKEEFVRTVLSMKDENIARAYYDKWVRKWQ